MRRVAVFEGFGGELVRLSDGDKVVVIIAFWVLEERLDGA